MTQTILFQVLNLTHWNLFGAWYFAFGACLAEVSWFHMVESFLKVFSSLPA
jgi:hypothetical protein